MRSATGGFPVTRPRVPRMAATPDTDTLVAQARAWIADDPDAVTRAELGAGDRRGRGGRRRGARGPGGPLRRHAGVRHRGPARGGRGRPEPDEPGGREPGRGGPGGVPEGHGRHRPGRHREGRQVRQRRLRPGHRRGDDGCRDPGLAAPPAAADARARLRHPRARLRGRRDGHGQPQPAPGQRLQGLPRRRQPDRPTRGRGDRRPDRRRGFGGRPAARVDCADLGRGHRGPLPRRRGGAGRGRAARPVHRLHAPPRGRRHRRRAGPRDRGLRHAARGEPAGAPRPGLPDRGVPQPGGAGRDGPRHGAGGGARRGPGGRQRPGRRPLRCGRALPARVADAPRRRGGRPARPPPARPRPDRDLRHHDRVVDAARDDGERCRPALRRDADRLQVDRPGRGARVRLRGGARLLLRPGPREGQGRRLGAAAALRAGGRRPRRPGAPSWTCSTTWQSRTACTRPTSCRSGSPTCPRSPRRWPGSAPRRRRASAASPSWASTTWRSAAWSRPGCPRPRACASGSPRVPAWWSGRAARSPSSSATSRSWCRWTWKPASTRPGSPRRPVWTPSSTTSARALGL